MPGPTRPAKVTLLMALAALALATPACRRGAGDAPRVILIGDAMPGLGDPLRAPVNAAQAALRLATAQGLVRLDPSGQVEGGLAERWNVSDDGLSYIFRLANGKWPDGRRILAKDVAKMLDRQRKVADGNPVRDALGAVDDIVAMTDRVIEIRLRVPRPNLLNLLAQPEFALIRAGAGTGPFVAADEARHQGDPGIELRRTLPGIDGEEGAREQARIAVLPAARAIAAFANGDSELVLGGTIADLPRVQAARPARGTLRFDPAAGLFGLVPARAGGPLADPALRRLLSQSLDRDALIAVLAVPGLAPRATILQGGLAGLPDPIQPAWLAQSLATRRAALITAAHALNPLARAPARPAAGQAGGTAPLIEPAQLLIDVPDDPGGKLILDRLRADWGPLGFAVERAAKGRRADLKWIDEVAPSDSPAWFLRHFHCGAAPLCDTTADELLEAARLTAFPLQRAALLAEAARTMDEAQLFIAIAAPVRWSLVSRALPGFVENRYARHPLEGLSAKPAPGAN